MRTAPKVRAAPGPLHGAFQEKTAKVSHHRNLRSDVLSRPRHGEPPPEPQNPRVGRGARARPDVSLPRAPDRKKTGWNPTFPHKARWTERAEESVIPPNLRRDYGPSEKAQARVWVP